MLAWRKGNIEKKLYTCYSIVYYYNGAQRDEQFYQVGRPYWYRALTFAVCLPRASVSSVFMVLYYSTVICSDALLFSSRVLRPSLVTCCSHKSGRCAVELYYAPRLWYPPFYTSPMASSALQH